MTTNRSALFTHWCIPGPFCGGGRLQRIIRQLHYVIKVTVLFVAPDLQNVDLALVRARDRFEPAEAAKFAVVRAFGVESGAIKIVYRATFDITATADTTEQFVIGN